MLLCIELYLYTKSVRQSVSSCSEVVLLHCEPICLTKRVSPLCVPAIISSRSRRDRYCFNRLPFSITSAPEHYQRRMAAIFQGLDGVVCLMDDVLVHGRTQQKHDEHLHAVMVKLQESVVTLNREKCSFSKSQVRFLGQDLSQSGISSDPDKVSAILEMRQPASVPEIRRFLGMVNQLSKFTPNLAEITNPLRNLLSHRNQWFWEEPQRSAFKQVKHVLTKSPVLAAFDPSLACPVLRTRNRA